MTRPIAWHIARFTVHCAHVDTAIYIIGEELPARDRRFSPRGIVPKRGASQILAIVLVVFIYRKKYYVLVLTLY